MAKRKLGVLAAAADTNWAPMALVKAHDHLHEGTAGTTSSKCSSARPKDTLYGETWGYGSGNVSHHTMRYWHGMIKAAPKLANAEKSVRHEIDIIMVCGHVMMWSWLQESQCISCGGN